MKQVSQLKDKRRARGDETRSRILDSAIKVIGSLGLSNLTLDRVAEDAGVSRTLVVFHFKSKKNLTQAGLDFLGATYSEGWNIVASGEERGMVKVLRLIDYDLQFVNDTKYLSAWAVYWGESRGNELYREQAVPRDRRYENEMRNLLADYMEEEGYDLQKLPSIVAGLNMMQFGVWVESHLDPKPDDYQTGMAAVRLFLANTFPNRPLPDIDNESD